MRNWCRHQWWWSWNNFLLAMWHDSSPCKHTITQILTQLTICRSDGVVQGCKATCSSCLWSLLKLLKKLFSCDAEALFLVSSRKKSLAHFCISLIYYHIENTLTISIGSVSTSEQGMKDATSSQEISEPSNNSWSTK